LGARAAPQNGGPKWGGELVSWLALAQRIPFGLGHANTRFKF